MEQVVTEDLSPLVVRNASKRYQNHHAIARLSFSLTAGSTSLLLGANGSGKSTLLRACVGSIRLHEGTISLGSGRALPQDIGFLGHHLFLYPHLTVRENLDLVAALRGDRSNLEDELTRWGLAEHRDKKIGELSRGLQYRAALSRALLHRPRFIILDEPTSSLDEQGVSLLLQYLDSCDIENRGGFLLIATHDISRLLSHATRVIVMSEGSIVRDSSQDESIQAVVEFYRANNR